MKLSLVTPVYNDPRLERALRSVESQEGDFELERIVVDGESDDPVPSIIDEHSDQIDVLVREPDDGVYEAMNKGIEAATGDVVGILNSDDRYQDDRVLADVAEVFGSPDIGVCYGDLVYVDEDDNVTRYWRSGKPRRWKWHLGWMPPHPTFFVRRELYRCHGTFDTDLPISADYELMYRLMVEEHLPAAYIPRVLVRMSLGGQSNESLANIVQGNYEVFQAWRNRAVPGTLLAPVLKPVRKLGQYVRPCPAPARADPSSGG